MCCSRCVLCISYIKTKLKMYFKRNMREIKNYKRNNHRIFPLFTYSIELRPVQKQVSNFVANMQVHFTVSNAAKLE